MWHGVDPKYQRRNGEDDLALVPSGKPRGKGGKKKPLAITDGNDSDDSMPSLQTVSDSSDEEDEEADDDDDFDDDDEDSDGSEDYDTDEEDELRDWLREAMDTAVASSDFYGRGPAPDFDTLAEERKGNPFLKILGSLRGVSYRAWRSVVPVKTHLLYRPYVLGESDAEDRYTRPAPQAVCGPEDPRHQGLYWRRGPFQACPVQARHPRCEALDRTL